MFLHMMQGGARLRPESSALKLLAAFVHSITAASGHLVAARTVAVAAPALSCDAVGSLPGTCTGT